MEMNNKVIGVVGAATVAGLGWAGYGLKKLANKVGMSIHELGNADTHDIVQSIAKEAVENSADKILKATTNKFVQTSVGRLNRQIDEMVDAQAGSVRGSLEKILSDKVDEIDTDALKDDIRQNVADRMADEVMNNFKKIIRPASSSSGDMSALLEAIGSLDDDFDKRLLLQQAIAKMGR